MRVPLALLLLLTSGAVLSADVVPAVFAPGVVDVYKRQGVGRGG